MSYFGYSLGKSYPSAEKKLAYATAPADKAGWEKGGNRFVPFLRHQGKVKQKQSGSPISFLMTIIVTLNVPSSVVGKKKLVHTIKYNLGVSIQIPLGEKQDKNTTHLAIRLLG